MKTVTDPAVRAAEFVKTIRKHGMHSAYAARMRAAVPVARTLRESVLRGRHATTVPVR